MKFIISAINWLTTTVMVIILLVGLFLYFVANTMIKVLPKSIDELTSISATVKTSIVGPTASIITPQEYPTQIEIVGDVQNAEEANKRIKTGDKVSIYLQKTQAQNLSANSAPSPVMIGYGLVLADGTMLIDPKDTISGKMETGQQKKALMIIAIPVAYFILLIGFKIVRRRNKAKGKQA